MDNATKQKLWKTADQLRSNMDAAEYKKDFVPEPLCAHIGQERSFHGGASFLRGDEYLPQKGRDNV